MDRSPITPAVLEWLEMECHCDPVNPSQTKAQVMFNAGKQSVLNRARQAAANDAEEAATRTLQT